MTLRVPSELPRPGKIRVFPGDCKPEEHYDSEAFYHSKNGLEGNNSRWQQRRQHHSNPKRYYSKEFLLRAYIQLARVSIRQLEDSRPKHRNFLQALVQKWIKPKSPQNTRRHSVSTTASTPSQRDAPSQDDWVRSEKPPFILFQQDGLSKTEQSRWSHLHSTQQVLSCFVRHVKDGIQSDVWLCRSRGDLNFFLDRSDFEVVLGRNALRLLNVAPSERDALVVAYRTLWMLRSCRYVPSDILMCVALAVCQIRKAAGRILVRSSTEAACVFSLQVFLSHCWLLDETCSIKEWHRHIFRTHCQFGSLNVAVMSLLAIHDRLAVNPDLVHAATHELTRCL